MAWSYVRLLPTLALLLFALSAPRAVAADKDLNLYIWSDYLGPDTIANFTKKTGIKVNVDVFDSSEMLEAKMLAGKSGYDVIVPNGPVLARLIKAGVLRPLDKTKLPHINTQDPAIASRAAGADPGNTHGVVYMWGTSGLGYNVAKVEKALGPDAEVNTWSLILDPAKAAKLSKCGIYVFDSPSDVFEFTLAYMGKDPHSTDPADYEAAGELWQKVRPYITKFHNSEYISALANGDICAATGFSGDVFQAQDRAKEADNKVEIGYAIPKEGAVMWFDFMAVPKDAPHPDAAHAFLDYILQPDVIAAISNEVAYANANVMAKPLLDKDLREDTGVYPDAATMKRLFPEMTPATNIERLRTRIWTRIKSGT